MSPLLENLYKSTGVDAAYIILGLAILVLVQVIILIIALCKQKKLSRKLDRFMRGKDAESLEDLLAGCIEKCEELDKENAFAREEIINIRKNQRITYQKMGMVKYDAFRELSGSLSYAIALLDQKDNGFVLNSVYSREGSYSYIKEIVNGASEINLAEEEQEALDRAKRTLEK